METKERIAIVGFMGSGKTTFGKMLAEKLSYTFVDLDQLIEESSQMKIRDIFEIFGEDRFREIESVRLKELARAREVVVACGGGIVEWEENLRTLKENFFVIYLNVPFQICLERIRGDSSRPLVKLGSEKLQEIYHRREPLYRQVSDIVFDQERLDKKVFLEELTELLGVR